MAELTTALLWLAQSTIAGLVALALPRVFGLSNPAWLASWWGSVAAGVVVLPVVLTFLPAIPSADPAVTTAVETTAAQLATPSAVAILPIGGLLIAVWVAGTVAALARLWGGARRLRRLTAAGRPIEDDALDEARRLAALRWSHDVLEVPNVGPCAFGWAPTHVIVPPTLRAQPYEQRRSVYLHELLHVGRGDVYRTWADHVWRALWWWQPAVWWTLARLRLAREQVVDAEVVRLTGAVRPYVDALVWCSTLPSATAATLHAGSRRHVLVRRVALMCKEESMSRMRKVLVTGTMLITLATVTGAMAYMAPLELWAAAAPQDASGDAGSLEQLAIRPSLDVPAPRRVRAVDPDWTPPAGSAYRMRVHAVVDAGGSVAEARIVATRSASSGGMQSPTAPAEAHAAVLRAVRQWEFEVPLQAPMLIVTDVVLGNATLLTTPGGASGSPKVLRAGGRIPPPTKVYDVPAVYPAEALAAKITGVVAVECVVGVDGTVSETTVVKSVPALDQAAVDAVRQWRYTPTLLNGEPVPVIVTVTVNFTLR